MRHAFLIMAHRPDKNLSYLLQQLDEEDFAIFLHMDQKSSVSADFYRSDVKRAKFNSLPAMKVTWGGYSQVTCMKKLVQAALQEGPFCYYHFLSADSLLLKSKEELRQFFKKHQGKEFLQFQSKELAEETLKRIRYYYWSTSLDKYKSVRWLKNILGFSQKLVGINRLKKFDFTPQKGGNWVSITEKFATYVVAKEPWFKKRFKNTYAPDEFFFQTLAENSEFKQCLFDGSYQDTMESCQRFILWREDTFGPVTLTREDWPLIEKSSCIFARKFNEEKDAEIIQYVMKQTKKGELYG